MSLRRVSPIERHASSFVLIVLISAALVHALRRARGRCQRWLQSFAPKLVTSVRMNVKSIWTTRPARHVPRVAERARKRVASQLDLVVGSGLVCVLCRYRDSFRHSHEKIEPLAVVFAVKRHVKGCHLNASFGFRVVERECHIE